MKSPQEVVDEHEITARLRELGLNQAQLDAIAFGPSNQGWGFRDWSFRFPLDLPTEATSLVKAYCTLKWLILENPQPSRDKDDAWHYLSDAVVAPQVDRAAKRVSRLRENSAAGVLEWQVHTPEDKEKWRALAATPDIARHKSKRRRAQLIAERLGENAAAIETIRKVI